MRPFGKAILISMVCAVASAIGTLFLGKFGYYTLVFAILFSVSMLSCDGWILYRCRKQQRQNENKPVDNKPTNPR